MVRRCFRNVGIWLGDEDAQERFVRGNESTRVGAPRAGYLAGESFGAHCLCPIGGQGDREPRNLSAGRVVLHFIGRRCLAGNLGERQLHW